MMPPWRLLTRDVASPLSNTALRKVYCLEVKGGIFNAYGQPLISQTPAATAPSLPTMPASKFHAASCPKS